MCRFPVAFRRTGIRLLDHPVPATEFRLPYGRPTSLGWTATGFPRCTRMRPDRGGRLLDPGATVSTRREGNVPAGIRRFPAASPTPPPKQPSAGALQLSLGLHTPPLPTTHAKVRTGLQTLARDHVPGINRTSNQRDPLTTCTFRVALPPWGVPVVVSRMLPSSPRTPA